MITYLYWIAVIAICIGVFLLFGHFKKWKSGFVAVLVCLATGWLAFYFKYEQSFVKNYGGVMSIKVPEGQVHIMVTWKDEHLWVENFEPKTNTCYFHEFSKGHILQGEVKIENCNPISVVKP